jgi:hypothetical protein
VAQQRVEVTGLVDRLSELLQMRGGPGVWAERRHQLVLVDLVPRQELRPGGLLGAELAQP